jgi:hypothetical protein
MAFLLRIVKDPMFSSGAAHNSPSRQEGPTGGRLEIPAGGLIDCFSCRRARQARKRHDHASLVARAALQIREQDTTNTQVTRSYCEYISKLLML